MGIPMAYNTGTTNTYTEKTVKRGTVALNPGPTLAPSYNWFNGVDVTSSQYLIYSDTYTMGQATQANSRPTAWTTPDLTDTSLLNLINTLPERIGQTPFTYLPVALKWLHQSNRYFLLKNNFENIVTSGLVLNLDASWPNSYSGTTTWFDLSGQGNNGSLYNTPTFSSNDGGSISFDGNDDYMATGTLPVSLQGNKSFTIGGWFKRSGSWTGGATWGIGNPGNGTNINSYNWNIDNGIGIDLYGNTTYTTNQTYSDTEWKHVVWTYNGSGFNRTNIIIYINGIAYTGNDLTVLRDSGQVPNLGSNGITLGRVSAFENAYYGKPIIGNFQVYNRVLSSAEIMQNFYAQGYRFGYSADTIVTSGLVLNLDAGNGISYPSSGTTWYNINETGGNNGVLINSPTFDASNGGSIVFDGSDDYVNLPTSFGGLSTFTVDTWFNPTVAYNGSTANAVITTTWNNGDVNYYIGWSGYITTAGRIAAGIFKNGWISAGSFVPTLNTWYNVSLTLSSGQLKMYVNGSLFSTVSTQAIPNNIYGGIYLGKRWDVGSSGNEFFTGKIPSVKIYNRALSDSEITQNYNALKGRFGL